MVITLVQIPGEKRDVDAAITGGQASTPTYLGLDGLLMKYYLNGDQGGVGRLPLGVPGEGRSVVQ